MTLLAANLPSEAPITESKIHIGWAPGCKATLLKNDSSLHTLVISLPNGPYESALLWSMLTVKISVQPWFSPTVQIRVVPILT